MTQKIVSTPLKILKLEAFLSRIIKGHPKTSTIESWLAKSKAGLRGERSLDFYLNSLNKKDYLIFPDIRLQYKDYFFQIDTLIIHRKFILILEVKNYSGTLIFDTEFNQLIRQNDDGTEEIFKDPIEQVNYQQFQFTRWLKRHEIFDVPIHSLVVIANDSSKIISRSKSKLSKKVIRKTKLLQSIDQFHTEHNKEIFTKKDLQKLSRLLRKHNTPSDPDLFKQFKITKDEIQTGVQCPQCSILPMKRVHGRWICLSCKATSKNAHIKALRDYSLLISPSISNQQLRKFLHIDSTTTTQRLLSSLNLEHEGSNKGRIYDLRSLWYEK